MPYYKGKYAVHKPPPTLLAFRHFASQIWHCVSLTMRP